jgi:hypothetical protein
MPSPWPVGTKQQFFEGVHRNRVYVRVFIGVSTRTYINIYIYIVFLKKNTEYEHKKDDMAGFSFLLTDKEI